jgi:TonB family protein
VALRVEWQAGRGAEDRLALMATLSLASHLLLVALGLLAPHLLPRRPPIGAITVVDLVSLPAGDAGPLEAPTATPPSATLKQELPPPPAEKPAPKSTKPEAVKLPDLKKPTARPKEETKPAPAAVPPPPSGPIPPSARPEPGPAPGVGGAGAPGFGAGSAGEIGALDAETFEFAWYRAALTQRLRGMWAKPMVQNLQAPLRTTIYFKIQRNGRITDILLETASGLDLLDRSALRAVYEANPLPPLPYAYKDDTLGVHFYFELRPE